VSSAGLWQWLQQTNHYFLSLAFFQVFALKRQMQISLAENKIFWVHFTFEILSCRLLLRRQYRILHVGTTNSIELKRRTFFNEQRKPNGRLLNTRVILNISKMELCFFALFIQQNTNNES